PRPGRSHDQEVPGMQNGGPDRRPPLRALHLAFELGPSRIRNRKGHAFTTRPVAVWVAQRRTFTNRQMRFRVAQRFQRCDKRIPKRTPRSESQLQEFSYTIITCPLSFVSLES